MIFFDGLIYSFQQENYCGYGDGEFFGNGRGNGYLSKYNWGDGEYNAGNGDGLSMDHKQILREFKCLENMG